MNKGYTIVNNEKSKKTTITVHGYSKYFVEGLITGMSINNYWRRNSSLWESSYESHARANKSNEDYLEGLNIAKENNVGKVIDEDRQKNNNEGK